MRLPRLAPLKLPRFAALRAAAAGRNRSGAASLRDTGSKPRQPFHAVSVVTGWPCCAAAAAMEGRRFLGRSAPQLPLPACDQASCHCAYQHHADRRSGPRRDVELGLPGIGLRPQAERRQRRERRVDARSRGTPGPQDYFQYATGVQARPGRPRRAAQPLKSRHQG